MRAKGEHSQVNCGQFDGGYYTAMDGVALKGMKAIRDGKRVHKLYNIYIFEKFK